MTADAPLHIDEPFPNAPIDCGAWTVPEEWIDYNGHMNVGYYGLAFDRGVDVVFDHWLDAGESYVAREGMGPFALQTHSHFLNELKQGEQFRILFQLLDCDQKRVHFFATMLRASDKAVAATCENISMNIDLAQRRSTPYPPRLFARIEALMAAHRDLPRPPQVGAPLGLRRRAG